jgi:hypothetical protein
MKNVISVFSKKDVLFLCGLFVFMFPSCDTQKGSTTLPSEVNDFIATHFPNQTVSEVRETKTMMDYEVVLSDGTEIDFCSLEEWESINFRWNEVPASFLATLPSAMVKHIDEFHTEETIHKIEKKDFGRNDFIYIVKFHKPNDFELSFTKEGALISDDPEGKHLPSLASAFLKKHYPNEVPVSVVEDVDGDFKVMLENNTEISFNRKGVWTELRVYKKSQLPESVLKILPDQMIRYVEKNYEGQHIKRVEKKSYGFRIKLNKPKNVELTFTKNGDFLSVEGRNEEVEE